MCGGPDQTHTPHMGRPSPLKDNPTTHVKKECAFGDAFHPGSCLLEFAADDDLDRFQKCVKEGNGKVDEVGVWYARSHSARQMVVEQRTPAMIASLYGSINVLTYILSQYPLQGGDVDHACGSDGSSALHCAAAGGSTQAIQAVKILIASGADINVRDIQGRRPADVIVVPHGHADSRLILELLLGKDNPPAAYTVHDLSMSHQLKKCFVLSAFEDPRLSSAIDVSSIESSSSSSTLSTTSGASTLSLSPSASSSPKSPIALSNKGYVDDMEKARESSVDQSLPDIKNTFYTSDEFRMYSFKIRPCSRAYSHDWTECPFAHPGENARRRDPRRYHYSCVPCPDFRKGACNQGDACEYAHGVFECWLHPAQYRTRLCKDGAECNRKVCFFAHKPEELRPVYAATGSGLPSPILSAFTDVSCMSPPLGPCSPSVLPPFSSLQPIQSTLQGSLRTPPLSPSSSLVNVPWPQPNIPTLHLPGASLQASRLRAALHARDVASNNDFDEQLVSDFQSPTAHSLSMQARLNAAVAASGTVASTPRSGRYKNLGLSLAPANLEELFASETHSSPGIRMGDVPLFARLEADNHPVASAASPQNRLRAHFLPSAVQSPGEAVCNLGSLPMQKVLDGEGHGVKAEVQGICKGSAVCNLGSLPMRKVFDGEGHGAKAEEHSICKGAASPGLIRARASLSNRQTGNWDFGAACAWSDWGSPTGKPEWGIQEEDLSNLRKSASLHMRGLEEPELLWRPEVTEGRNHDDAGVVPSKCIDNGTINIQQERADLSMVGTWIEKLCLDEIVA